MENNSKKLFFIAGERSGDMHGANLIASIVKASPSIITLGWGGDQMQSRGMHLLKHYKEIAFMGIWEVIKNLAQVKKFLTECKNEILSQQPDAVVLIDYGGFNMKIAKFCKENGIAVHFYISPKVWAWNVKRAYKMKQYIDFLYCILPFEPKFFEQFDYKTEYVGNPVVDAISNYKSKNIAPFKSEKPIVAILPGSRKQEVSQMLALMIGLVSDFPKYTFVVTAVDNLDSSMYDSAREVGIQVVYNQTYEVLSVAKAALVTSGTATLETALFSVPQAVCYKTSALTYEFAKFVLKIPYISLVNLIADKEVVKELIQRDFNPERVENELRSLLENESYRKQIFMDYEGIQRKLGTQRASDRVAELILKRI